MIRIAALFVLGLLLAGCTPTPRPHPFVVPDPFQIPLPFVGANQNLELLSGITEVSSISVAVFESEGVLPPEFASEVAGHAQELDVPASSISSAETAYRLTGEMAMAIANQEERLVDITIAWRLAHADGETFQEFTTSKQARFADAPRANGLFVSDEWWQELAAQSASDLRTAIDASPEMAARYSGITEGRIGPPLIVPEVTGAPGDGNESLTRAIRALLGNQDINVIDPARPPDAFEPREAYTLQGQVALGDVLENGGQVIALNWDLYTSDGRHLGNVAQQNLIEPGSLDGAWGETAVYAALAATDGIVELLGAALPAPE